MFKFFCITYNHDFKNLIYLTSLLYYCYNFFFYLKILEVKIQCWIFLSKTKSNLMTFKNQKCQEKMKGRNLALVHSRNSARLMFILHVLLIVSCTYYNYVYIYDSTLIQLTKKYFGCNIIN